MPMTKQLNLGVTAGVALMQSRRANLQSLEVIQFWQCLLDTARMLCLQAYLPPLLPSLLFNPFDLQTEEVQREIVDSNKKIAYEKEAGLVCR